MAQSRFIAVFSSQPAHLFEIAPQLSSYVEIFPPNGILIKYPARYEQDTLNRLSHLAAKDVRIGGASSRTVAILVARTKPGTLLPFGREKSFLDSLPLHLLNLFKKVDPAVFETFSSWGITTLGELAALPARELTARMGPRGEILQRIARGEDVEALEEVWPETPFEESRRLDWSVDNLEPLFFLLGEMLDRLCARLKSRGLAAEELGLCFELVDGSSFTGTVRPAFPMQDPKVLLSLTRLELQGSSPPAGIVQARIQAKPARPRIFQHSLLQPTTPHPEKFSQILTRLRALVGASNVGSPGVLDTHRPDAFQLKEPRIQRLGPASLSRTAEESEKQPDDDRESVYASVLLSLRRMRPPQPIEIRTEEILSCAGPWRSSGEWWTGEGGTQGWSREEWDVELSHGGIFRIFWDHDEKKWFLEGVYD